MRDKSLSRHLNATVYFETDLRTMDCDVLIQKYPCFRLTTVRDPCGQRHHVGARLVNKSSDGPGGEVDTRRPTPRHGGTGTLSFKSGSLWASEDCSRWRPGHREAAGAIGSSREIIGTPAITAATPKADCGTEGLQFVHVGTR